MRLVDDTDHSPRITIHTPTIIVPSSVGHNGAPNVAMVDNDVSLHTSSVDRAVMVSSLAASGDRLYRNWQMWPAQNRPICGGRYLMGPDAGTWLCNIALFTGLATLFAIYVAYDIHISLVVITGILVCITLWALFKATFTEAGILPRLPPKYLSSYIIYNIISLRQIMRMLLIGPIAFVWRNQFQLQ